MKKSNKWLLLFTASFAFAGCSFFEEPTNTRDLDYVFNNGMEVRKWISRSYGFMPDPMTNFRSSWNQYYPWVIMADEADSGQHTDEIKSYRINIGDWNPSESGFGDKWTVYYAQIRHLYQLLDRIHVVEDQQEIDTQKEIDDIKLEARFLIAYFHEMLFEYFGPIPIIEGLADIEAPIEELRVARNSVDEVVDWLDAELLDIAGQLPDTHESLWAGKPTKGAALALRARLLLLAARPLFNSPDDYAGYEEFRLLQNKDGKRLFPQSYDKSKWKRAADAAALVIALPQYSLHETEEKTGDKFVDAYKSYREVFTIPGNSEVIFARNSADFYEFLQGIQPRQWQAGGFMGVTQKLVDAFYMSDGKDINDSELYVEDGFTTDPDAITVNKLVTDRAKIEKVYNMYQNREPRFYVSVFFNGRKWDARDAEVNGEVRPVEFFLDGVSGPPNADSPRTGYTSYKYVDDEDYKDGTRNAKAPVLFRLGEVYLNYAEALNQYEPGNTDILLYLNKIRNRAGIDDYEVVYPDRTSQAEIHDAIMRERQIELNWEGSRYFDTRCYFKAEQEDAGDFYGMNVQGSESSFYQRAVFETRVFKKSFYLFPIPQTEIDKNSNLVQNPYWD